MSQTDHARLYRGSVMHRRLRPVLHQFSYPVFFIRLRLDALHTLGNRWFGVDCWRLLSVRQRDYGPRDGSPLLPWIRQQLAQAGLPHDGHVWLQTFPRIAGFAFNPVSFWHCHNGDGALCAILAEVNNTFGEHHGYLLASPDGSPITPDTPLHCRKQFHVSPFCRVEGGYRFRFRETAERSFTGIDLHDELGPLIQTSISGQARPFTRHNLLRALLAQPLLTLGIVWRIHWQALQLWLKKVPFHHKPPAPGHAISSNLEKPS
ncbi:MULTISPECIES: DUF1365 domain-containing protein [unclassified Paludibacterium]|uniref:DUF1365 domain-containing protein n=1 Tax=unclassified Paludibacterium TaxID=2618429 RepID=UPI00207B36AB|nr:DUF1365 domain-containing protein [Paludibacterium sp. B53371]BEV70908.1 DUF1365 domain-containing protein [Paludibacterium sp. THUN1379]